MNDDQEYRGFSVTPARLQVRPNVKDEIMIGLLCRPGGCRYEFALRWYDQGSNGSVMRLEMYDEALSALVEWPDLMAWLATRVPKRHHGRQTSTTTVEEAAEALRSMGFEDRTIR